MNELKIKKFENAYGIKKLILNNLKLKNNAIYASNGTFKTSFALALYKLSKNEIDEVRDRLTNDKFTFDISIGDNQYKNSIDEQLPIIIFSKDILEKKSFNNLENELATLTLDDNLINKVKEYEDELIDIDNIIDDCIKSLKLSNDIIDFIVGIDRRQKLSFLKRLFELLINTPKIERIDKINLNILNKKKIYEGLENDEFKRTINDYRNYIENQFKSTFFDDKFNLNNVNNFIKTLETTNFINESKNRYIVVYDTKYTNLDNFKTKVNEEIKKICNQEILDNLKNIDKVLGVSRESKEIRTQIVDDYEYVSIYSKGSKSIFLSMIYDKLQNTIDKFYKKILEIEALINGLLEEAKNSKTNFDSALDIFKKRFNTIFDVIIENKNLVCINKEAPKIVFKHNRGGQNNIDEHTLYDVLSSGERTCLNIIKFIVEYENKKNHKPIIVLDDIIETFDYSNRYAFINYLIEMKEQGSNIILLTHNYEFYKNVTSRVELEGLVAICDNNYKITIQKDSNINFKPKSIMKINSDKNLIVALPFIRELANYIGKEDHNILLSYLHYNQNTNQKTVGSLIEDLKSIFPHLNVNNNEINTDEIFFDKIISIAKEIPKDINPFELEIKIILSIAIRLLSEKLIIQDNFSLISDCKKNQTRELYNRFKNYMNSDFVELLDQVLIITPEFIHLNAFMYEPLIDIHPNCIRDLFLKLLNYDKKLVWKTLPIPNYVFIDNIFETKEKSLVTKR